MVVMLRQLPPDSAAYARQLERIVLRCCPLADRVARHFDRRGENLEDLMQVARVGLLQAVNRFDPARGSRFVAFALPTMMGELRRYFRDYGWKVHVPRRIRDRQHDIACVTAYLTNDLRRAPSIEELAEELEIDRDQVVESIVAAKAYQPQSLDVNVVDDDSRAQALGDSLGEMDAGFDRVTDRESVRSLLAALPRREQKVLYLRYFGAMTQRQIADSIGVSQMHVSRILDRTLRDLRAQVGCA
ncbi:SigB/SigF/SigG family RNA polymerase sigma factor [Mycolicibacterium sp. 141076]|uniref:SigB/SigF/SigG family RNA polymerase sigma factor n=1 Tax=Mycobacteriaceae TaxID=1762 RepID=UPI00299F043F|nr:SigB/SigF/SigG family RNA polymerase sigma factor [Mycolicibacterium sp. 141076]MDX1877093.1 SigB/SigF/SigG family RNA polymerase sigma factor [Mycolicibacterium sp. 141076]